MSDESYVKTVFAGVSKEFKFQCRMKVILRQFSPNVKTVQISMSDESYVKTVFAGVSKQFKFQCQMKVMLRLFSPVCQNSSNFDVV